MGVPPWAEGAHRPFKRTVKVEHGPRYKEIMKKLMPPLVADLIRLLDKHGVKYDIRRTNRAYRTLAIEEGCWPPSIAGVYFWHIVQGTSPSGMPELRFYSTSSESNVYLQYASAEEAWHAFEGKF